MMKSARNLSIVAIMFFALMLHASAQSPREQLNQMVEQLQKTPSDSALRERIIKLAPTLKPSPALPDTANAFEGRAQFAFKTAKSEDDFIAAAREYEKAVAAAPWVLGYYADLCTIYEKAGKFENAKRHCGFYLIGLSDPAQMAEVKRRIAGLEFGIEQALAAPRAPDLSMMQGTWVASGELVFYYQLRVAGDTIRFSADRYVSPTQGTVTASPGHYGEFRLKTEKGEFKGVYVEGRQGLACAGRESPARATLSANGNELTVATTILYDWGEKWDPRGFQTGDTKSCVHRPKPEWRFVMRKQA